MPFFTITQNNSGGFFLRDAEAGIDETVIVEATDEKEAKHRFEEIGLYWNGVDQGIDCECCGDRWYFDGWDKGTDTPEVYGMPPADCGRSGYIHYSNGTVEAF